MSPKIVFKTTNFVNWFKYVRYDIVNSEYIIVKKSKVT